MLTPKPFLRSQKINKAIHKGRPNLFNAVDLNRHFDILKDSSDFLWKMTGTEYNNPFTNTSLYNPADSNKLTVNLQWTAFTVIAKAMEFSVAAGSFINYYPTTNFPGFRIYLVATKQVVTFSTDPAMSGVNGGLLPSALAGSDHEVFSGERLAFALYPDAVILNPNEEVIAKIATIIPYKTATYFDAKLYSLTNSAYTKLLTDIVGTKFGGDISLVEINQYVLDYFLSYLTEPLGVWKGFHGVINNNFDASGLGVNRFIGWAFMNGANGTPDWRGRVPLMFDNRLSDPGNGIWDIAYNFIGNTAGVKKHTLSLEELPNVNLQTPTLYLGKRGGGSDPNTNIAAPGQANSGGPFIISIPLGSGVAHENRQPSAVTGFILRIT